MSSSSVTRRISSLESGSPGTIAVSPLLSGLDGRFATVQAQPLGPFRFVLTVAGETVLGQDRPDFAIEVDSPGFGRGRFRHPCQARARGRHYATE